MDIKKKVAWAMTQQLGIRINPEKVVLLPIEDDNQKGTKWEVYAARCRQYAFVAYVDDTGSIDVNILDRGPYES